MTDRDLMMLLSPFAQVGIFFVLLVLTIFVFILFFFRRRRAMYDVMKIVSGALRKQKPRKASNRLSTAFDNAMSGVVDVVDLSMEAAALHRLAQHQKQNLGHAGRLETALQGLSNAMKDCTGELNTLVQQALTSADATTATLSGPTEPEVPPKGPGPEENPTAPEVPPEDPVPPEDGGPAVVRPRGTRPVLAAWKEEHGPENTSSRIKAHL